MYPVTNHTDYVGLGTTFVAVPGYHQNGVYYIPYALEKGATTIVYEKTAHIPVEIQQAIHDHRAQTIVVDNARIALAELSNRAAGYAVSQLRIIGITGTKGKTSTAWLLHHILNESGIETALLSTVENKIKKMSYPASLTTANADYLHQFFAECVQQHVNTVVMEVAAQAVTTYRTHGISFDGIIFTNFAREHLEFYATINDYFAAKCSLIKQLKQGAPLVIGVDHEFGDTLLQVSNPTHTISNQRAHKPTHYYAQAVNAGLQAACVVTDPVGKQIEYTCPYLLPGFNNENIALATTMASAFGVPDELIKKACLTFVGIPGRLEQISLPNGAHAIIDYAHNPLSYASVFPVLRKLTPHLIAVFGSGGNRDAGRRPIMGNIAAQYADTIILTSDNPRNEDPAMIVEDIMRGIPDEVRTKVMVELDREKAINKAYALSAQNSLIALLGKGPESYQIVGTEKKPFSEKKVLEMLS